MDPYLYILLIVNGRPHLIDAPGQVPMMFAERAEALEEATAILSVQRPRRIELEYRNDLHQVIRRELILNDESTAR